MTEKMFAKALLACIEKAVKRIAALTDAEMASLQSLMDEYPNANPKRRVEIVDTAWEILVP